MICKRGFSIIALVLLALALVVSPTLASALRSIDADTIKSSDHTKTQTMPASTGTLLNTASNIPVAGSMVQEVPSGTCNGSTTSFTLANTPGGAAGVLLWLDGQNETQGAGKDYTISGAAITLTVACASGQTLWASYPKF